MYLIVFLLLVAAAVGLAWYMKLIPDWRTSWKYLSVKASVIWSAVMGAWMLLPQSSQESMLNLLPWSFGGKGPELIVLIGFVSVLLARLKAQNLPPPDDGPTRPLP